MQFQNAIITNEGVRIFQAALADNPVVFTKCLFSGSATPLTASMVDLPEPTWGDGHVTNYAANDSGGDFIIYASATNATDYGYAYGYGIYGYLQNEGIENEKLLVVANYDGNVTYVSEASGPYTRFHFAITIKLSMAAGVLSIAPHYNDLVSDAAFQNLANRTVTTHSATDDMVGDDQTILGDKTFVGQTQFGSDSQSAPTLMIDNDENDSSPRPACARLRAYDGEGYGAALELTMGPPRIIYTNAHILPMTENQSLGDMYHKWGAMSIISINTGFIYASHITASNNIRVPTAEVTSWLSFYSTRLEDDNIRLVWYDQDAALKFQQGAVRANVEFDVPVKFNAGVQFTTVDSMTLTRLTATGASIGTLNTSTISANEADVTQLGVGSIIASALKTASFKLNGELSASNYPIQQNNLPIPIGAIRLVAVDGLQDGQEYTAGSSLFGLTLIELCLHRNFSTGAVTFTNASVQRETSGGNYITLFPIKWDYGTDAAPVTLVMKVRDDMP